MPFQLPHGFTATVTRRPNWSSHWLGLRLDGPDGQRLDANALVFDTPSTYGADLRIAVGLDEIVVDEEGVGRVSKLWIGSRQAGTVFEYDRGLGTDRMADHFGGVMAAVDVVGRLVDALETRAIA